MIIHLDASFLIRTYLSAEHEGSCIHRRASERVAFHISTVAWSEYLCGPLGAEEEAVTRALVVEALPLLAVDAELGAKLYNLGGRRRGSLPDCLIAASAIRAGAPLATSNRADFDRFSSAGLRLA